MTQDPMDPDAGDVIGIGPLDRRDIPPVEPVVFNADKAESAGGLAGVVIVLGALVLVGSCMVMTPTMGSTRSARLEWQRRQLDIEEAVDSERSEHSIDDAADAAPAPAP